MLLHALVSEAYCLATEPGLDSGADPEVEEGGGGGPGHRYRLGLVRLFFSRTYNAQRSRKVWGHAPI